MADIITIKTTIADGQTKTEALNIQDYFVTGVEVPASMTGTVMTLEVGETDTTTVELRETTNTAITFTISTTAAVYPLDARYTAGAKFMKVVTGTAQSGAKNIKLHGYRI